MNEKIMLFIKERPWVIPASVGAASFAAGAAAGYFYGKQQSTEVVHVTNSYSDPPEVNFQATVADILNQSNKTPSFSKDTDTPIISKDNDVIWDEVDQPIEVEDKHEEPQITSVFAGSSSDDWDYEKELANRTPDTPYVIHQDEYFDDENNFSQTTLTYYAGDDILTDSQDTPVYGYEAVIGELKFGHGSEDSNAFYVRNERLKGEYEILKDPGLFSQIILGFEADEEQEKAELKHSRSLKFRPDD